MNAFAQALANGNFVDGSACLDCYFAVVADGLDEHDSRWNEAKMMETRARYDITPGHMHDGPYSNCTHKGAPCEDDCDCEHDDYSRQTCSLCGTDTHGTRDAVILIERSLLGLS